MPVLSWWKLVTFSPVELRHRHENVTFDFQNFHGLKFQFFKIKCTDFNRTFDTLLGTDARVLCTASVRLSHCQSRVKRKYHPYYDISWKYRLWFRDIFGRKFLQSWIDISRLNSNCNALISISRSMSAVCYNPMHAARHGWQARSMAGASCFLIWSLGALFFMFQKRHVNLRAACWHGALMKHISLCHGWMVGAARTSAVF